MSAENTNQPAAGEQQPVNELANIDKNLAENVLARVKVFEEGGSLNLTKNYSAGNALKIAWLMLQETTTGGETKRPVLDVCTKASIANALLKMIIQGLNPAKRQCSFIAYGNQLTMQREYQGTIAIAKRKGVKNVSGQAVFKGDVFEYIVDPETAVKKVTKHEQKLENLEGGEVVAAYAIKEYEDGRKVAEVMSIRQIRLAWQQGKAKGNSVAHNNFTDEMAIKTVYNRLLKSDINSSDDSDVLDEEPDAPVNDTHAANTKLEITDNANKQELGFTQAEISNVPAAPAAVAVDQPKPETAGAQQKISGAGF